MNMFARFDENPAMTLQDIKKNKMLGTHTGTDNMKTVYPPQTKFAGGIKSTVLDVDLTLSCLHGQIKVLDFTDKNITGVPFENSSSFCPFYKF